MYGLREEGVEEGSGGEVYGLREQGVEEGSGGLNTREY